ncbi:MAG: L-seryl-tRNA(Sec) selenium transferase [Anaerolineae bacterium]|jgi:L-seryl-tRNA(Ser) seleniumtransferase|nr:L-seryl-tRNA(Sec) selenium transferase [Anaerolineae bacterium]
MHSINDPELRAVLRALTSVDRLVRMKPALELERIYGREATVKALRAALTDVRLALLDGMKPDTTAHGIIVDARRRLRMMFTATLRPVINATGVIVHTNLGRAVLSDAAQKAVVEASSHYVTMEYDLNEGRRSSHLNHTEILLKEITGAEAALVVNNNAAASLLALTALAKGKKVIVSRGQLGEMSGGFRVPDIIRQAGAKLVEVGTTNRTRARDYERAIDERTALILRVNGTTYRQVGFTDSAPVEEVAAIAHNHALLCVDDIGSGALLDTTAFGLVHEPTVQESLMGGSDLVWFSGDKLLGGPQAGILVGRAEIIDRLRRHPMARALRADKLCIAALTATLDHYRRGEASTHVPVWRMLSRPMDDLVKTLERWLVILKARVPDLHAEIIQTDSALRSGGLPGETTPTVALAVRVHGGADGLLMRLRQVETPIIARIEHDEVVFDPRTVFEHQEQALIDGICAALVASEV